MQKKIWILMLVMILALVSIIGCSKPEEETIVAEINDRVVTLSDFNQYYVIYSSAAAGQAGDDEALKKQVLTAMVDMEAIKEYLKDENIEEDEKVDESYNQYLDFIEQNEQSKKFIEDNNISDEFIKNMFLSQLYEEKFVEEIRESIDVEAEITAYYEENKEAQFTMEQVRASHVLLKTEEEAKTIKNRADNGEDFATLAIENSIGPSKDQGGDLGYFGRGQMVQPFEEAVFQMEVGEISDIVQTEHGYHVIKLTDKRSEIPLEEAYTYIESIVISEEYGNKIEEIKAGMDIKEYEDKL